MRLGTRIRSLISRVVVGDGGKGTAYSRRPLSPTPTTIDQNVGDGEGHDTSSPTSPTILEMPFEIYPSAKQICLSCHEQFTFGTTHACWR